LKKSIGWRTALVIEEIEDEVSALKKAAPISAEIDQLMDQKEVFEIQLMSLYADEHEFGKKVDRLEVQKVIENIEKLDHQLSEKIVKYNSHFNPYWGTVMRAGNEESYLAGQVDRYACIYMSKISDLNEFSPRNYFRPQKRLMAHE
jgi:hypothetical protein